MTREFLDAQIYLNGSYTISQGFIFPKYECYFQITKHPSKDTKSPRNATRQVQVQCGMMEAVLMRKNYNPLALLSEPHKHFPLAAEPLPQSQMPQTKP